METFFLVVELAVKRPCGKCVPAFPHERIKKLKKGVRIDKSNNGLKVYSGQFSVFDGRIKIHTLLGVSQQ